MWCIIYIQKLFSFPFFSYNNELSIKKDSIFFFDGTPVDIYSFLRFYPINYFHQFGQEVGYLELAEEIGSL